jgi:hypothetical protein
MKSGTLSVLAVATAAASMSLPSAPARADDTGFFVGANVGRVLSAYHRKDLDNGVVAAFGGADEFTLGPSSIDKSHAAWSADAGYMLSPNFGVEASYLYLGSFRYSAFGTATPSDGTGSSPVTVRFDTKSHGPALSALGVLPMLNFWEVDARLGAYEAKTTTTYASTGNASNPTGRLSKTSTSLLVGVGTGVTLFTHCTVRLDYVRLEHVKERFLDSSINIDLLTLGVAFVF